jgi:signal transduction histidine kinase
MPYSPRVSVFEHIRSAIGRDAPVISLSKVTLVRLAHLLEDFVLQHQLPALIFSGIPSQSRQNASEHDRQLAAVAKHLVIFDRDAPHSEGIQIGLHVELHEQDALCREWFLVIYSSQFSVALCGQENSKSMSAEAERQLNTVITFDPAAINQVMDVLEQVMDYYRPKSLTDLQTLRQTYPPRTIAPWIMARVASDILRIEEGLNQQLLESEERRLALEKEHEITHARNNSMMTIAHEFRTPLAIIASAAQILDLYFEHLTPEQRHERLEGIMTQVGRLSEMINDLSRMTQKVQQEQALNLEAVNLAELCVMMVNELQTSIGVEHHLIFTAEGVPDEIWVDKRLIGQIVTNLLSNAIKYSRPRTEVQLGLSRSQNEVSMLFSDQGIGIPENELQHIFDPFYRSSNVGSTVGLGLGLAIVSNAVLLHSGRISVHSQPGAGTIFTIHLPIRGPEATNP